MARVVVVERRGRGVVTLRQFRYQEPPPSSSKKSPEPAGPIEPSWRLDHAFLRSPSQSPDTT